MAILISEKIDFKTKIEGIKTKVHFIMRSQAVVIIDIDAPKRRTWKYVT